MNSTSYPLLKKQLLPAALVGCLLASPLSLLGQDTTWTGNSSGFWGTSGNWTNNAANESRNAIFDATATRFSVDLGARDRSVLEMTIDSATKYTFTDSNPGQFLQVGDINVLSGSHQFVLMSSLVNGTESTWTISSGAELEAAQAISGTLGLVKEGGGNLVLRATNTYSGGTIVNDGTLTVYQGINNALNNTDVTLNNNTDLIFDDQGDNESYNVGSLNGNGNVDVGGGIVTIGGTSGSDFTGDLTDTVGDGGAVKSGDNTWTLNNSSNAVSSLTIQAGSVVLGNAQALDGTAIDLEVDNGLDRNGANDLTFGGLSGSGDFDAGSNLTLDVTGTATHTGELTTDGTLTKTGTGTQTIANLPSGVTDVSVADGELEITGAVFTNLDIDATGTFTANGLLGKTPTGNGTLATNGNLLVGDGTATDGYAFAGTLDVRSGDVSLLDADQAELGSSTTLDGGTLTSTNGILLGAGETLTGSGTVNNAFENLGTVTGQNAGLTFTGIVEGDGDFLGDVTFDGVYSPGNSPAEVTLEDPTFNFLLEIEMGGLTPGSEFDLLNILGDATLGGVLDLSYLGGFSASEGDIFLFLSGAYSGTFSSIIFPDAQNWFISYDDDSVSVGIVPEPNTAVLLLAGLGLAALRRRP